MMTKAVKAIKQIILFFALFLMILSCEKDIEDIGTNIVENGVFDTQTYDSEVRTYNKNILKRRANKLGQYLLGVYKNDGLNNDFGQLEASIITQLAPSGLIDFGLDPSIDTVIVQIPYSRTDTSVIAGTSNFELDFIGHKDSLFNLNVYQLETYLNTLDPTSPSDELNYFTDQTYNYNSSPLYSGLFSPKENDTVLYVKRPEVIIDFDTMECDIDTIIATDVSPSIKLPLNKDFFADNFLPYASTLQSTATFVEYFNGLYIEATPHSVSKSTIMSLGLSGANLTMYYTNTVIIDETVNGVDLNGDGSTTSDAEVRTKQSAIFNFSGITTNSYIRDYVSSNAESYITTPNTTNGDDRLYLQGAAGSFALIDLFTEDDIEDLRNNEWLINEASLTFYVDQNSDTSIVPEQLFVYNYEDNEQITDMFTEGPIVFDGTLQRDGNEPVKYTVNITDYVSNVLKPTNPIEPSQLAVRVLNVTDIPTAIGDSDIKDFNWIPKGVVIHGNQSSNTDKRIKLEITYTELN